MREMVSCFSENSVNVSNSSYSCKSYSKNVCIDPGLVPSVQNAVVSVYRIAQNARNHRVTVTWCRTHSGHGLTVDFGSDPSSSIQLTTSSRLFRKKKGSKMVEFESSKVEAFWDLSAAKFDSGPEPVDGFYVLIMVDSEIGLLLGDSSLAARKLRFGTPAAEARLVSRREHCSGNGLFSTTARFSETGIAHELVVKCGESVGLKNPTLSVSIDKKVVIRVKRLHWNFRGNQTIFVDGLLVDLMWDCHDWFYSPVRPGSNAVFMFRTRSGLDSRLWLEEKLLQKDEDRIDFSLLIYATRSF